MRTPRLALVTAAVARPLDQDLAPLASALTESGAAVTVADWDDPGIDWAGFDLVVLRSTWDYTLRLPEFLAWADRVAAVTALHNPLAVIRWNTDKHYLLDLARAGVPVVPSAFLEPTQDAADGLDRFLTVQPAAAEVVVKPSVGAGSRDAQRHGPDARDAMLAQARRLLAAGRSVLLQPYLASVDTRGETAVIFFAGEFDHAIRKGALLKPGEAPTRALFAAAHITSREADEDELSVARHALHALPSERSLLYARVDLLRDDEGLPRVLELELTEPTLFLGHAPGSAGRYARVIMQQCSGREGATR
jgi:glutathione synthase/RimK-type ligase-like ATP-grasp enzyme